MIKALLFDVFGTVVDWRTGVINDIAILSKKYKFSVNAEKFADDWRAQYQPSMEKIRLGDRKFVKLDTLHEENLKIVWKKFNLNYIDKSDWEWLVKSWHRLPGWQDSSEGLLRLKTKFIIAAQSNGNIELILNMSKKSKLFWDMILGSEVVGYYKPQRHAYLIACEKIGLSPNECMMVAAHKDDLLSASKVGMKTAYVHRPFEHGQNHKPCLKDKMNWTYKSKDFLDLADQLNCKSEVKFEDF